MNFPLLLIYVVIAILLYSNDALGSTLNVRIKRLSNSGADTSNMFKHEARIITQDGLCTGTIIDDKFILTAAHCVVQKGTNQFVGIDRQVMKVTVGITMVDNLLEFPTVRLVEKIYIPKTFTNIAASDKDLKNMIGDIAVLKLNHRLGLGIDPRIESFKIPPYNYEEDEANSKNNLMFTGFGGTQAVFNNINGDYEAGVFPFYLQYSKARIVSPCHMVGNAQLKICAKLVTPTAGVCGGDSGGALIDIKKKAIIGVLGYGAKRCNDLIPGVYTRVFPYYSLIMSALDDIVDETARRETFEYNENYNNALEQNAIEYNKVHREKSLNNVIDDNAMEVDY